MADHHDVLIIGAGWRACARRSRPSKPAPTLHCSRSSTRRAPTPARPRAASTRRSETRRRQPGEARLRHGQGLRLPGRPGRDRDPLRRGAGRRLPARALGRGLLPHRGRADRAAAVRRRGAPRTAYAADITGHVLVQVLYEQVMKRDIPTYEEFFGWKLIVDDGRCQGVIAWDIAERRPEDDRREDGDPRHGRRRPALRGTTNAYACTGDGMAMALRAGVAAEGHGDDAVPPDDACSDGRAHHRGLPRRGRVPAERGGRALPEALRAERDGARARATSSPAPSRPRSTRAAASTATCCSTCATSGPSASSSACHGTRELSMVFVGVDPIHEPIPVRPGAHYHMGGVDTDVWGRTQLEGLYAAGEVGLRLRARREPARRQRADGDDHVRQARRAGTPPSGRCRTRPSTSPRRARPTPSARSTSCSRAPRASVRGRSATSSRRRCTRTSASSAARSRCSAQGEIIDGLRERYERVIVDDKGDVFNNDLTQALELGYLLDLAECMVVGGRRAQGEPRRAREAVRLPRARRRELPATYDRPLETTARPRLDWKPVTMTKWQPQERRTDADDATAHADSTMDVALKIWRYDSRPAIGS